MDAFRKRWSINPLFLLICAAICCGGRVAAGDITVQSGGSVYSNTPPPSASFEALLSDGTSFKPDTHGAVGPNHLMVTLNTEVRIQNRSGVEASRISLDQWWAVPGSQTANATNVSDPQIVYDPYGGRFIFSANNGADTNPGLLVAVSATSDPTGPWYRRFIDIDATGPVFADSPAMGFNRNWIVLATDTYYDTAPYDFRRADIFAFNKTNLYADGSLPYTHFPETNGYYSLVPVVTYDANVESNFLVSVIGGAIGDYPDPGDISGVLGLFAIGGPVTAPTFTDISYPLTTNFLWADSGYINMAPQSGTTNKIYLGDSRITSATWRRGTIQVAHTVFLPWDNPTRAAVQWWEFTPEATFSIGRIDSGTSGRMYAYPSIAANQNNDIVVGFSRFSTNEYPSAAYAYREDTDEFNSLREPIIIFKAGNAPYYRPNSSGNNLWGDWSATMVDPLNDTDFWTIQEYAEFPQGTTNRWGTWWARISPPNDLVGTLTDSPDPVVAGSNLTYTITVTNLLTKGDGGRSASGVRLSNSLPAGVTFISASASQGTWSTNSPGVVVFEIGTLTNLTRATASIVVKPTVVATITNTVAVHANGPDTDYADNVASASTVIHPSADLQVFLAESEDPVTVGNNLIYTVIVTNSGPAEAILVKLTNNLPPSCTLVGVIVSGGTYTTSGSVVSCNLPNLLPGATATVTITARPTIGGIHITNRANVASSTTDTVAANNAGFIATYVNARPTITAIPNQIINEDTSTTNISFTIGDLETPAGNLRLATNSSNTALIPHANIVVGGSGSNRTVRLTPAPNQSGQSTITISVTDAAGATSNATFVVTVNAVNDVPTITPIANPPAINEDTSTGDLPFTIGDVETAPDALSIVFNSSNVGLVPLANIQRGGTGANRTVRVVPATNQNGSATITVTVSDGAASSSQSFVVTVNPVNDAPDITPIADRITNEDTSIGPIPFSIIDVESGGALTLTATSSNPALAPTNNFVFGGSGTNRTVTIQPVSDQSGMAEITITASDGSLSDSSTFSLTVDSVNDTPTLTPFSNLTTSEDSSQLVIGMSGITSGAANESQVLSVTASSSNPAVIESSIGVNYTSPQTSGSLVLRTVTNAVGPSTITVTARDDGASNNSVVRTFTVTLTNINDRPVISAIANQTTDEDVATPIIEFAISDVETPPDLLAMTFGSSDTSRVPLSNFTFGGSGTNRTLRLQPAPDQSGAVTITIGISDGDLMASTNFVLTINPVNDAPRFVSPAPDLTIAEDSSTTNAFTVGDPESPATDLTISAMTSNAGLIPLSGIQLGGSGSNRTIVLSPATNAVGSATITLTLSDGSSNTVDSFVITVTNVNDAPHILTTIADQTIVEDSATALISFTVQDEETPAGNLTMTGVSSDPSLVPAGNISFGGMGSANRTVRVTPAPDKFGSAMVTINVSDGAATNSRSFLLTVTPINDVPVISSIPNVVTNEDFPTIALPFTMRDAETLAENLTLAVSSSNPEVVEDSGITIGGMSTNRTVTVRPLTNQIGSTTITIMVTDASNAVAMAEFEITFNPVNDLPSITDIANFSVNEDTNSVMVSFTIEDPETLPQDLTVTATSSGQALVPNSNLVLGGSGTARTLTMMPLTNQFGTTTISIFVGDGTATNTETFVLTVNPVNDRPTITGLTAQTIAEDTSTPALAITVDDVDTNVASLILSAESSNSSVIPVTGVAFGGTGANRTVTVTPALHQFGSSLITVTVSDGMLTASTTFNVTVTSVNDAPTINAIANLTILEDAPQQTVTFSGVDSGAPNENQALVVIAASSNPSVVPNPLVTYTSPQSSGTLRFTAPPNASGSAILTVTVDDGQSVNRFTTRSFRVTVTETNDTPTISNMADIATGEDTPVSTTVTIGDVESAVSALTLTGTSSNAGLLANSNITFHGSGALRTVVLTPTLNQFGTSVVTVTVSDGVSTANESFVLTVTATNDPPTLDPMRDVYVNQGAANNTVTLTGISSGAANESQTLVVSSSISTNIFQTPPSISYISPNSTATLSFRPGNGPPGTSVVTIVVSDGAAINPVISRSFTIHVKPTGNAAPTISAITNRSTLEDTPITIPFVVNDTQTPADLLRVKALSTNLTLLAPDSFVFSGAGNNRALTITPAANLSGSALVTVSVTDTNFGGASTNFVLTVTAVNDLPVISAIASQTIQRNSASTVMVGVWDVETPAGNLVLSATSSNPTLVPVTNIVFGGSGTNRSVTVTPATNQVGSATIGVIARDASSGSATNTFVLTVVNNIPTPLAIVSDGDAVTLSWAISAGAFVLQSRTNLTQAWTDVSGTPIPSGGQNTITETIAGPARFYRLRSQ